MKIIEINMRRRKVLHDTLQENDWAFDNFDKILLRTLIKRSRDYGLTVSTGYYYDDVTYFVKKK